MAYLQSTGSAHVVPRRARKLRAGMHVVTPQGYETITGKPIKFTGSLTSLTMWRVPLASGTTLMLYDDERLPTITRDKANTTAILPSRPKIATGHKHLGTNTMSELARLREHLPA